MVLKRSQTLLESMEGYFTQNNNRENGNLKFADKFFIVLVLRKGNSGGHSLCHVSQFYSTLKSQIINEKIVVWKHIAAIKKKEA